VPEPLVTVARDGHVLSIGVNRPEKRNAFTLELIEQFVDSLGGIILSKDAAGQ
jgi:enoyl-CoA hydratase/carnithine racemase